MQETPTKPLFSKRTESLASEAIEAVASALTVIRPEVERIKMPIAALLETLDVGSGRIEHEIEVEAWKSKTDPEKLERLKDAKSDLDSIRSEIDEKVAEHIVGALAGLMESIRRSEKLLEEYE